MTTLRAIRLAAGAGDVDPSQAYRIDVIAAAEALYDAYNKGDSDGIQDWDARLMAAVRRMRSARKARAKQRGGGMTLTPREHDVLSLLCAGQTNKSISFELRISHRTVEIHRHRIMKKLAAKSAVELGVVAVRTGIL